MNSEDLFADCLWEGLFPTAIQKPARSQFARHSAFWVGSRHRVLVSLRAAPVSDSLSFFQIKIGIIHVLLLLEADTATYSGRLGKARELSRQADVSSERAEEKETAAVYEADAAVREALFGNAAETREGVWAALGLSTGRDVQ